MVFEVHLQAMFFPMKLYILVLHTGHTEVAGVRQDSDLCPLSGTWLDLGNENCLRLGKKRKDLFAEMGAQ